MITSSCVFRRTVKNKPRTTLRRHVYSARNVRRTWVTGNTSVVALDELIATTTRLRGRHLPQQPPRIENPHEIRYRSNDMWDDALRVAKFHGGQGAHKRVAYAWALALGGEAGAKLLTKQVRAHQGRARVRTISRRAVEGKTYYTYICAAKRLLFTRKVEDFDISTTN